jgi:hypothetical protein
LQRLSTRKVYVVIPIDVWDAQLVAAVDPDPLGGDLGTQSCELAVLVGNVVVSKVDEVDEGEVGRSQLGAHRAVTDHDTLRQGVEQVGVVRGLRLQR